MNQYRFFYVPEMSNARVRQIWNSTLCKNLHVIQPAFRGRMGVGIEKNCGLGPYSRTRVQFFSNTDLSASHKISRSWAKIQRRASMVWKGRVREILCCRNFLLLVHVFVTQTLHSPPISPYPTAEKWSWTFLLKKASVLGNTDGKYFFQILSFPLICAAGWGGLGPGSGQKSRGSVLVCVFWKNLKLLFSKTWNFIFKIL